MRGTNGSGLLDWNDARIFLAVARNGSLRAAGRALGISQPTIGRRIAAFEAVFGGPTLFDRLPEGLGSMRPARPYCPLPSGWRTPL
jgi:DNA-binding transcriptional LysR family regulator